MLEFETPVTTILARLCQLGDFCRLFHFVSYMGDGIDGIYNRLVYAFSCLLQVPIFCDSPGTILFAYLLAFLDGIQKLHSYGYRGVLRTDRRHGCNSMSDPVSEWGCPGLYEVMLNYYVDRE
jgi:hypothetical protein